MEEAWLLESHGHTMVWVEGKIGHCQYKLKWWSKVAIGNITRQLKEKKEHLRKVEDAAIGGKSLGRLSRLEGEINDLLSKEGKMWRKRSRTLWLHKGDGNTRFFHSRATHRFW